MAGVASLTKRDSVLVAMADYDRLGRDAFLNRHHFGRAKWWYVVHDGKQYDSKAIVGTAIGIETGHGLTSRDFSGGEASAVRKLRSLGFTVVRVRIVDESPHLPEEVAATFPEGLRSTVTINRIERSAAARLACIEAHGTACAVCGTDLADVYGPEYSGMIHVHHLYPLAGQTEQRQIDPLTDLRPVCPNCHAAIHYGSANRTIEEVRTSMGRSRRAVV
jgi:5-methylcytosine-specific restriction protein A